MRVAKMTQVSAVEVLFVVAAAIVALAAGSMLLIARRRRRAARVLGEIRADAFAIVAGAEHLARLRARAGAEPPRSPQAPLWAAIREEHGRLASAARSLRLRACGDAFKRATSELDDALVLFASEIARAEELAAVPNDARNDDRLRFASARLQERSDHVVFSARYVSIVADVEGC
jgi:hypothetical protein